MEKTFLQNTKIIFILKGLLFSYVVTALTVLLLSFLMLKLNLPSAVISGGINFIYILSAFTGGFYIGDRVEHKRFLWGLAMGVMYFVILMIVSLIIGRDTPYSFASIITVFIITSLSGMLGGMLRS
jgi:putative membrane protein (TIGR04086 family)